MVEYSDNINIVGKMYAHGISQGSITAASGGKFQHGFFSAALSSGAGEYTIKIKSNGAKILASSVVGGTASVLGGGKFANGAVTGAFVMLFNHMSHSERKDGEIEARKSKVDFQKATDQQKIDQLLYAFDYENMKFRETGEYSGLDLNDYFDNLPNNKDDNFGFKGNTNIEGMSIEVKVVSFPGFKFQQKIHTYPKLNQLNMGGKYINSLMFHQYQPRHVSYGIPALQINIHDNKQFDLFYNKYIK